MSQPPPPTEPLQRELELLQEAHAVLEREDLAITAFDMDGIDDARAEKVRIDQALRGLLADRHPPSARRPSGGEQLRRHRELCLAVRERARRNQLRLEAMHAAVHGLLSAMRGSTATQGYGRPQSSAPQPVLTSSVE